MLCQRGHTKGDMLKKSKIRNILRLTQILSSERRLAINAVEWVEGIEAFSSFQHPDAQVWGKLNHPPKLDINLVCVVYSGYRFCKVERPFFTHAQTSIRSHLGRAQWGVNAVGLQWYHEGAQEIRSIELRSPRKLSHAITHLHVHGASVSEATLDHS